MKDIPEHFVREFIEACHDTAARGLVRCSSGNMSLRLDSNRMLITTSRSWMGILSADDVCVCSISDGTAMDGKKPSVEIGFHAGILRARPEVNVVLQNKRKKCLMKNGDKYSIPRIQTMKLLTT